MGPAPQGPVEHQAKVSRKKVAVLLDFVQINPPPPSPQFGQLFFNAQNFDLSDIQNNS